MTSENSAVDFLYTIEDMPSTSKNTPREHLSERPETTYEMNTPMNTPREHAKRTRQTPVLEDAQRGQQNEQNKRFFTNDGRTADAR